MRLSASLFAVFLLIACDSETPPGDAGASMDSGPGTTDSGGVDAGDPPDGGPGDDSGPAPDGGGVDGGPVSMPCMAAGACDPFDGSSCPSGEKCSVTSMGAACVTLTMDPPLAAGAPCAVDADCGPLLWCVSFGEFVCTPMCANGSIGQCGDGLACIGTVGEETCARVCRPIPARCNIYTQDCGDPGLMCTFTTNPESGENYTGCRDNGTLGRDEPCGGDLGRCERGFVCIRQDGATTCRQVCGIEGGEPTCETGLCTGLARTWGVPYCR